MAMPGTRLYSTMFMTMGRSGECQMTGVQEMESPNWLMWTTRDESAAVGIPMIRPTKKKNTIMEVSPYHPGHPG